MSSYLTYETSTRIRLLKKLIIASPRLIKPPNIISRFSTLFAQSQSEQKGTEDNILNYMLIIHLSTIVKKETSSVLETDYHLKKDSLNNCFQGRWTN